MAQKMHYNQHALIRETGASCVSTNEKLLEGAIYVNVNTKTGVRNTSLF